ncbi:MAG: hypothetical protein CMJ06_03110 [Pelagibacterales bacterium]|nr:hypothetical protein [Pelagibacterales bacterium]OUU62680.1 MAG: hypothetical protein CBC22_03355 [Alphaproteobacteria bacterium TMED62]|tara:strand:- start:9183 stop:10514 length:1332 start_codon:yes stop_codon:yes gene_type:complete
MLSQENSNIYKKLYSEKNIDQILSDESFIKKILIFEKMLAKANYELEYLPYKAYQNINKAIKSTNYDTYDLQYDLEYSGVITINLLNQIKKNINKNYIPFLHYGATSQDSIDTALILQIKDTRNLFVNNLKKISYKLHNLAINNKKTYAVGRTRNKTATLTTFGFKVANWLFPILRNTERLKNCYNNGLLSIQLGGPVGNLSLFNEKGVLLKKKVSNLLNLDFDEGSWHNQRDRIVEFCNTLAMTTGSIAKIANDMLVLSQDEISEIIFSKSGSSSSMPHKNNPVIAELLVSLAKLNYNQLSVLHESLIHKNERDGVSLMIEWHALYSMLRFTSASIDHFNKCLSVIKVNKKAINNNIDNTYGVIMSDYFFIELLKVYPYSKLEKIYPRLVEKALNDKIHLLDILEKYLGKKLNINTNNIFLRCVNSTDILIRKLGKKLEKTF